MKEKYYIGKLYRLNLKSMPSSQELFFLSSLYFGEDQNRKEVGTFVFTKTLGGYKEVKTGKVFDFYADRSKLGMPPVIPKTRLFVDRDSIRSLKPEDFDTWYQEYDDKLSAEKLNQLFEAKESQPIVEQNAGSGPKM